MSSDWKSGLEKIVCCGLLGAALVGGCAVLDYVSKLRNSVSHSAVALVNLAAPAPLQPVKQVLETDHPLPVLISLPEIQSVDHYERLRELYFTVPESVPTERRIDVWTALSDHDYFAMAHYIIDEQLPADSIIDMAKSLDDGELCIQCLLHVLSLFDEEFDFSDDEPGSYYHDLVVALAEHSVENFGVDSSNPAPFYIANNLANDIPDVLADRYCTLFSEIRRDVDKLYSIRAIALMTDAAKLIQRYYDDISSGVFVNPDLERAVHRIHSGLSEAILGFNRELMIRKQIEGEDWVVRLGCEYYLMKGTVTTLNDQAYDELKLPPVD